MKLAINDSRLRQILARLTATIMLASCLTSGPAFAQSSSDEAWYWRLVSSVGKFMFFCAWPTDTYDHMEFGHIERRPNGAAVYVVLYGKSWLEGDLWTEVVAEMRNGSMTDMHFGRYSNKALIAPGTTVHTWANVLDKINDELKRQQASQTTVPAPQPLYSNPVSVLCINNPTQNAITYSLPSEQISTKTLPPGQTWMFWHDGPAMFTVSFNGMKTADWPRTVHVKGAIRSGKPASCDDKMIYEFIVDGSRIGLAPRTWVPGSEDSFNENLYRGEKEGLWVCASGYKWASADANDTTCIPENTGLIGILVKIEPGDEYPTIVSVRPDGSAGLAGVPVSSRLVQVNDASMQGRSVDDVVSRTRGPMNSEVRIGVVPPGSDHIQYFDLRRR